MLSSGFIKKVLKKVESNKVNPQNLKKILFDIQKDRELFESIFESMIEGVIVVDDEHKIQYINHIALDMLNIDNKSVIDQDISNIFSNSEIKTLFNKLQNSFQNIHNQEIEIENEVKNSILRINAFPLKKDSQKIGTILMFLDITKQKEEQAKLRTAESLASLTTLAAGVAHEIKNPLSSIDIHIQLMERMISDLQPSIRSKYDNIINIISEEIERLNRIITDFLFSVRPTILNKKMTNLEKLFNDIFALISIQTKDKGINLTLKVEKNFPDIICDPNYIKNAFINILKNSIEACKEGDNIIVSLYREDNMAIILIEDTGKGINKKSIKKIFEPYFTTKDFGTGLGLTIVYKIIDEHKGDITVSSKEKKGTTFKIKLPIYDDNRRLLENRY